MTSLMSDAMFKPFMFLKICQSIVETILEVFRVFGHLRKTLGNLRKCSDNVQKCLCDLRTFLENLRKSLESSRESSKHIARVISELGIKSIKLPGVIPFQENNRTRVITFRLNQCIRTQVFTQVLDCNKIINLE